MTPANHKRLCDDLRRTWTKKDGVVAIMTSPGWKRQLRICISGQSQNLRAYTCVIWCYGNIVYDGPMEAADMREILTTHGVCRGRVSTSAMLKDDDEHSHGMCYGTGNGKACAKCRAARLKDA